MRLSKSDILQAIMIGLTLLASAIAVPMIISEQKPQSTAETPQEIQQPSSSSTVETQGITPLQ
jgi:flagellar basal body-associated protein FliL